MKQLTGLYFVEEWCDRKDIDPCTTPLQIIAENMFSIHDHFLLIVVVRHKPNMEIYEDVEQNDAACVIVIPSVEEMAGAIPKRSSMVVVISFISSPARPANATMIGTRNAV